MKYILAHDIGTSRNKSSLFDIEGNMIASEVVGYEVQWSHNGWAEQNPEDWYKAICQCTNKLIAKVEKEHIVAISLSGQMQGCLCVDANGSPLYNSIIWADLRASKQVKLITDKIAPKDFYAITGHRPSLSYTLAKLLWIKEHKPEIFKNTYKILNTKDYIIYKLTCKFYTDFSDASSTNLFDISTLQWSETIAEYMGLDLNILPNAVASTTVVGEISVQAANETGLKKGTPVVCGGGDGAIAAVGAKCIKQGTAFGTVGTSAWNAVTSTAPIFDPDMKIFTFAHVVPGMYTPMGTMQTAGAAISWAKNELLNGTDVLETSSVDGVSSTTGSVAGGLSDGDLYQALNKKVLSSKIGANGLIFLPYLMGERSPHWNEYARGSFIGLSMESTNADMLRAVYEGIAFNLSHILNLVTNTVPIKNFVLTGGGAKSQVLCQILADMYNIPISIPNYVEEATSIGAAVCAGVGVGVYKNFENIDNFIKIEKTFEPIAEHTKIYKFLKPVFEQAYSALVPVFEMQYIVRNL